MASIIIIERTREDTSNILHVHKLKKTNEINTHIMQVAAHT